MRKAGRITGEALLAAAEHIRPGVSTAQLDRVIHDYILKCSATPTFLGYNGFPASACISVNNEVIHGIPSKTRFLEEGDIVSIDTGATFGGFVGDSANTFPVGRISPEAERLIKVTKASFYAALEYARPGNRLGDIGQAVQTTAESNGYSVVRQYTGHGVGRDMHEDPEVRNFGVAGHGLRLLTGMTIAIEPMVNAGGHDVKVLKNGWTVVTVDGSLSAHYEHTVAITDGEPILLTSAE